MEHRQRGPRPGLPPILLGALWLAAFVFTVSTFVFFNDHFDRISRARQIARYREWPFSDFFDAGYFMTEFASAALQRLFGDSLLGDLLLSSTAIAAGTTLVATLCWRVSRSVAAALTASALALLAMPRPYDFDKVLFYPLAVWLCWRYADAPRTKRLWALSAGAILAALFRYDSGVYVIGAAAITVAAVHAGNWPMLRHRLVMLAAAVACLSLPVLVLLQLNTGLADVADQVVTYARREGAGTRVVTLPALSITTPFAMVPAPPPNQTVIIRWQPTVDENSRPRAEQQHGLLDGASRGEPGDRTWKYRMEDVSATSIRALLQDPAVEDVSGIDRAGLRLTPEPWLTRAQRAVPLLRIRVFPGAWTFENANAIVFYLFHALPMLGILALVIKRHSLSRHEIARVAGLITLCVALNVFILRQPLLARIGGMMGPAVILAVWLARGAWDARNVAARVMLRVAAVVVLCVSVWSVSVVASWREHLKWDVVRPSQFVRVVEGAAAMPPDPQLAGSRVVAALVQYIRECTRPADRILVTYFAPEIPFFAQRAFAGGLLALWGGHWSEARFQQRSLQALTTNPPLLVLRRALDTEFDQAYPLLSKYLAGHYSAVGTTETLGVPSAESFVLLAASNRTATSTYGATGMPCFGE